MTKLNGFGSITTSVVSRCGTNWNALLFIRRNPARRKMPAGHVHAERLRPRPVLRRPSNRTLLKIIADQGLYIDASSLNEARRAELAGIEPGRIMLTTQEVPEGADRRVLEDMMLRGMRYNVCSLRQLRLVADFASANGLALSVRVHPGVGSGESATRNTGDDYSCFGIHLTDIAEALQTASEKKLRFTGPHPYRLRRHPEMWRRNIDLELGFVENISRTPAPSTSAAG